MYTKSIRLKIDFKINIFTIYSSNSIKKRNFIDFYFHLGGNGQIIAKEEFVPVKGTILTMIPRQHKIYSVELEVMPTGTTVPDSWTNLVHLSGSGDDIVFNFEIVYKIKEKRKTIKK